MPEQNGALTEEEKQKAISWIRKHWATQRQKCPICGDTHFTLGSHIVNHHIAMPGAALTIGAPVYPFVMLFCNKCRYTLFFNAVAMGLAEPYKSPEEAKNG